MFDPHSILGISKTALKEEARAAFRRLASKHHPDKGGDEEKFKQIRGAWEMIDNDLVVEKKVEPAKQYKPTRSSFTQPESAFKGAGEDPYSPWYTPPRYRQKPQAQPQRQYQPKVVQAYPQLESQRKILGDFVARVSMAEAYNGFILEVLVDGKTVRVNMPKGVPHGLRNTISIGDHDITVTTLFHQNMYTFVGTDQALREAVIVNSAPGVVYRTKDLALRHEIRDKDLRNGTTLKLQDFLGETYTVKVQAGHDPRKPIRVEGRGYVDWYSSHSQAGSTRGDVLITLIPTEEVPPTVMF